MKAQDIKIPTFMKGSQKDGLEESGKFNAMSNGIPYTSDVSDAYDSSEFRLTGRCEKFDLSEAEDRQKYADLCARFLTPCGCERLWEQRVPADGGCLLVYVAYTEMSKISYNTAIELKDKEEK